jgi:hypothetical protein
MVQRKSSTSRPIEQAGEGASGLAERGERRPGAGRVAAPESQNEAAGTGTAALKVLYLLAVTAAIFAVPALAETRPARWFVIPALLALQAIILLACRVGAGEVLRPVWRLKWLFVFLLAAYALLPSETPVMRGWSLDWQMPVVGFTVSMNLAGLAQAGLMCLQIITLLLATSVVRLTGSSRDLAEGLKAFRLPRLFVYSLDRTLGLLAGTPTGRGGGQGGGRADASSRPGFFAMLRQLLRGDIGALVQSIQGNLDLASAATAQQGGSPLDARASHDVAVISGIALGMASLKMLKFLPGVPFASGHKALLLFPLYVLAARLTYSRWGATAAGSIMGVIGFLQGDGRFGLLEIFKHVAPGIIIDLAEPVVRRWPRWALGYCVLGLAAAVGRVATEFALVALLGARSEVYLFPAAKLVPNLLAGFLSGFITIVVLRVCGPATTASDARGGSTSPAPTETPQGPG